MDQKQFDELLVNSEKLMALFDAEIRATGNALAILAGSVVATTGDPKTLRLHIQAALEKALERPESEVLPDLLTPVIELLKRKEKTLATQGD